MGVSWLSADLQWPRRGTARVTTRRCFNRLAHTRCHGDDEVWQRARPWWRCNFWASLCCATFTNTPWRPRGGPSALATGKLPGQGAIEGERRPRLCDTPRCCWGGRAGLEVKQAYLRMDRRWSVLFCLLSMFANLPSQESKFKRLQLLRVGRAAEAFLSSVGGRRVLQGSSLALHRLLWVAMRCRFAWGRGCGRGCGRGGQRVLDTLLSLLSLRTTLRLKLLSARACLPSLTKHTTEN